MENRIDPYRVSALLTSKLGNPYHTGGEEIRYDCLFCQRTGRSPDTKGRLWINPTKGVFFCFRCETKGRLAQLLSTLGLSLLPTVDDWVRIVQIVLESADSPPEQDDPDAECQYPCEVVAAEGCDLSRRYLTTPKGVPFWNGVNGRGLSIEAIRYYRIVVGTETPFKTRVFIPTLSDSGVVTYWVARGMTGEEKAKYLNPSKSRRSQVFNLAGAMLYDYVIICEGVMSAIAAGPNGVATFGKLVSNEQILRLANAGFSRYYVALDGDAQDRAIQVANSLDSLGKDVWLVPLPPDEDPDSVPSFEACLRQARRYTFVESTRFLLGS